MRKGARVRTRSAMLRRKRMRLSLVRLELMAILGSLKSQAKISRRRKDPSLTPPLPSKTVSTLPLSV